MQKPPEKGTPLTNTTRPGKHSTTVIKRNRKGSEPITRHIEEILVCIHIFCGIKFYFDSSFATLYFVLSCQTRWKKDRHSNLHGRWTASTYKYVHEVLNIWVWVLMCRLTRGLLFCIDFVWEFTVVFGWLKGREVCRNNLFTYFVVPLNLFCCQAVFHSGNIS